MTKFYIKEYRIDTKFKKWARVPESITFDLKDQPVWRVMFSCSTRFLPQKINFRWDTVDVLDWSTETNNPLLRARIHLPYKVHGSNNSWNNSETPESTCYSIFMSTWTLHQFNGSVKTEVGKMMIKKQIRPRWLPVNQIVPSREGQHFNTAGLPVDPAHCLVSILHFAVVHNYYTYMIHV